MEYINEFHRQWMETTRQSIESWKKIDWGKLPVAFLRRGGENEVFTGEDDFVIKLNNFEYAGDDLTNFFHRIEAHNCFLGNVPYDLIGFAYNSQQKFCAVLSFF